MKPHLFLQQYIKNPRNVGALFPSSSYLAEKMVNNLILQQAKFIVELGPGTGVFTQKILMNRNPDTIVMLIECNKTFYSSLKKKYKDEKNLIIINGSAENIDFFAKKYGLVNVDYVVSGLPFASLPKEVSDEILNKTMKLLGTRGRFITFQYSLYKKEYINQFFTHVEIKREYRNFPPAFILSCSNESVEKVIGI